MNRRAFATPTVKAVLAGVVTLSAVTAAGLSYLSTRSTRDFSPSANLKDLDDSRPSNRATAPSPTADSSADSAEDASSSTDSAPEGPARTFAASGSAAQIQDNLSTIAAKISSMAQIVSTAGEILSGDREALAERATTALAPLILGTPESFAEALKSLGAAPSDAETKPGGDAGKPAEPRTPPFTEVLAGAELDLENITIAPPKEPDFGGAGRTPSPGSGAYRAPVDADGNAAPKRIEIGGSGLPSGEKPKGFEATMMARIGGAFPEVEKRRKELPSVEVSIPARTKGSTSTQPDMDIGVTMTKGPDGNWVPTGYTVRVKNPDVLQTMMKSRRGPG